MNNEYDVVIIGSSPVCLAESIYQASQGRSVCIIENKAIGGSWKYIDALGFKNIELGPHVLNGSKLGKKSMELFNIPLVKENMHYFDVKELKNYSKNLNIEKHYNKSITWIKKTHKHPINLVKALYNIARCLQLILFKKKDSIFYLRGGTYELITSFTSHPLWKKIDFNTSQCTNIETNPHKEKTIKVVLASGRTIDAKRVFLTLGCNIEINNVIKDLFPKENQNRVPQHSFNSLQVLLLLKNNYKKLPFTSIIYDENSYVGGENFLKNKDIKYISDITKYISYYNKMDFEKEKLSVIALAVNPSSYYHEKKLNKSKLLEDLKLYQFISSDSSIIDFYVENFDGKIIDYVHLKKYEETLNHFGITILQSDNLLNSFAKNYHRWKPLKKFKNLL